MARRSGCGSVVLVIVLIAAVGSWWLLKNGYSARPEPSTIEAEVAEWLRHLATPSKQRDATNPVAASPEVLMEARAHFADHCATCHGNDGRGKTEIGQHLYPRVPDMTKADTQSLTDGEIFYIIHNGVRLTGMPAWGDEPPEKDLDSWKLVHFVRHLPRLTPQELEEMGKMNPVSPMENEERSEADRFLQGKETPPSPSPSPAHH